MKLLLVAAALLSSLVAAACGGDDTAEGTLTVFAASSLTEAFTEIGAEFASDHPGVDLTFNFGASSTLARQITDGSPAAVFAAADEAQMARAVAAGAVRGDARVFATNVLEVVVAAGNPLGITDIEDLARGDVVVVLAAPEVPIGRYSAEVLERAGVGVEPASYEENVKAVVNKVALGEADAGIVYATDVVAADGDADGVAIAAGVNITARYPIAALTGGADAAPELADAFVEFVLGDEGRAVLARFGFGPP